VQSEEDTLEKLDLARVNSATGRSACEEPNRRHVVVTLLDIRRINRRGDVHPEWAS